LAIAAALAPPDFDDERDGLCIHRAGTVLYVRPPLPKLLGVDAPDSLVGRNVLELVRPSDRDRVADLLDAAAHGHSGSIAAALEGPAGQGAEVELTALRAVHAMPPVDVLYVRCVSFEAAFGGEDEAYMEIRDRERTSREHHQPSVLICDDEARLGALTAGLLSEYGFKPVTVGTGEEALAALGSATPAFDVLLLDVNLSHGKSAREVLATMRMRGIGARVILTSGLAAEDVEPELMLHPLVVGYVAKPYAVEQLVQSIRLALATPRQSSIA
jgi:CheY-like chemotaxis protein